MLNIQHQIQYDESVTKVKQTIHLKSTVQKSVFCAYVYERHKDAWKCCQTVIILRQGTLGSIVAFPWIDWKNPRINICGRDFTQLYSDSEKTHLQDSAQDR